MNRLLTWNESLTYDEIEEIGLRVLNDGGGLVLKEFGYLRSFARAEGVHMWDVDGVKYLDFLANFGVLNLGHNPEPVIRAVREALDSNVCNFMIAAVSKYAAILANNLAQVAPGALQRVFFSNSGTESVECALKLARAATGKPRTISIEKSFHGKTFGSLSASGNPAHKEPFEPLLSGFKTIRLGDLEGLERELSSGDVAAFIVEPIMGEGGVVVHPPGFLKEAERLCRKHDALLIADEVQTGLGRTGRLFAVEHEGVEPDIMCLAKALSGGVVPIGATLATDPVWQAALGGPDKNNRHSSTFGGSAAACIAGITTLETVLNTELVQQAAEKGRYLRTRLEDIKAKHEDQILEVRGEGLFLGVEFRQPEGDDEANLGDMMPSILLNRHQIVTFPLVNRHGVLRVEPPLTVSYEQLDYFADSLGDAIASPHE